MASTENSHQSIKDPFVFSENNSVPFDMTTKGDPLVSLIFPPEKTDTPTKKIMYIEERLRIFLDLLKNDIKSIKSTKKSTGVFVKKIVVSDDTTIKMHGDFHGNYDSLRNQTISLVQSGTITSDLSIKKDTLFILLGDYADRGNHGLETFLLLILLKEKNPDQVFLLKGNHDESKLSMLYGFAKELCLKLSIKSNNSLKSHMKSWQLCFDLLPELIILDWKNNDHTHTYIPCIHAGIESKELTKGTPSQKYYEENCLTIKKLLTNPNQSNTTLNLAYAPYFKKGNPYAWSKKEMKDSFKNPYTWFDISEENATHTEPGNRGKSIYQIGSLDIKAFIKKAFPRESTVPAILRGHQQNNRKLFSTDKHSGIAKLLGGLVWTLDYSPENSKIDDSWLSLQRDAKKIGTFKANITHFKTKPTLNKVMLKQQKLTHSPNIAK